MCVLQKCEEDADDPERHHANCKRVQSLLVDEKSRNSVCKSFYLWLWSTHVIFLWWSCAIRYNWRQGPCLCALISSTQRRALTTCAGAANREAGRAIYLLGSAINVTHDYWKRQSALQYASEVGTVKSQERNIKRMRLRCTAFKLFRLLLRCQLRKSQDDLDPIYTKKNILLTHSIWTLKCKVQSGLKMRSSA